MTAGAYTRDLEAGSDEVEKGLLNPFSGIRNAAKIREGMPKVWYHGTSTRSSRKILDSGFKPSDGQFGHGVYGTDSLEDAKHYAKYSSHPRGRKKYSEKSLQRRLRGNKGTVLEIRTWSKPIRELNPKVELRGYTGGHGRGVPDGTRYAVFNPEDTTLVRRVNKSLSPKELARAKARARAAGRPYPNAFDNMVAGGAKWHEGVHKNAGDLELPQQLTLGIPVTRFNPISPLVMLGSSSIMADAIAGAMGRNLSRRERKHVREQAYRFTSASGMLYSPLGYGAKGNPR